MIPHKLFNSESDLSPTGLDQDSDAALIDSSVARAAEPAVLADSSPIPSASTADESSAESGGLTSSQVVSTAASNIVFSNTYGAGVTQAYINCITSAEQGIESLWTAPNSITIKVDFVGSVEGQNGDLATNSWPSWVTVTYAQLKSALASHEYSVYAQDAVAALPASDPNPAGGSDWYLPEAYARMLGLSSSTPSIDDTITLNTSYPWSYGQDVINTLEHEISEGAMGRVGGLGDQNGVWSTMDLFRFNSSGARDYTDGRDGETTYFSYNGGSALSSSAGLSFNNEYSGSNKVNPNDTADFTQLDVFGTGEAGEASTLSQTDIEMMDVLGWEPVASHVAPTLNVTSFSVAENTPKSESSFFSVSNPSGDNITQYSFLDEGSNGHFTVNGVTVPDGQSINVSPSNLGNVQYVGGSLPGSETLEVSVSDQTTGTTYSAILTATTTAPHIAPTVTAVSTVSVAENQSIAASSLIASISGSDSNLMMACENRGVRRKRISLK